MRRLDRRSSKVLPSAGGGAPPLRPNEADEEEDEGEEEEEDEEEGMEDYLSDCTIKGSAHDDGEALRRMEEVESPPSVASPHPRSARSR